MVGFQMVPSMENKHPQDASLTSRPVKTAECQHPDEGSPLWVKSGADKQDGDGPSSQRGCGPERYSRIWFSPMLVIFSLVGIIALVRRALAGYLIGQNIHEATTLKVAFVGNSMLYFNDFPRFFTAFSGDRIFQNSVLHGGGSIPSLLMEGNSMFPQFATKKSVIQRQNGHTIYDFGACTVQQLMTGFDDRLDDPGYAVPTDNVANSTHVNLNPCREDPFYLHWSKDYFAQNTPESWDIVLINDNTRDPARASTRAHSEAFLEQFWVPLLQQTAATPVFLLTQAYAFNSSSERNMTGLDDVANFTSLTYAGLKAYVELLKPHLPESQQPRIAPVGLGYLMIYEERRDDLWPKLFHNADHLHASPLGSFLQACIVHHTLFDGRMPDYDFVVRKNPASLWKTARMMQHAWEPPNPFPTQEEAAYLYSVAERICVHGERPKTFIDYQHGETAYEGGGQR